MNTKMNTLDYLVFAPHPDDAEIFCGGLIAKATSQGHSVGIIDLSMGEMASRGSVEERKKEALKAKDMLGLSYRDTLDFPDTTIGVHSKNSSRDEQIKCIVACIRKLTPKIVVIPHGDERHPDHWHARSLLKEALFFAGLKKKYSDTGEKYTVKHVLEYMCRQEFEPSFLVDITEVIETKRSAIQAFSSQTEPSTSSSQSEVKTLVSDPLSLHSIQARDAYYGSFIGVQYAEPYLIETPLSISDPLSFFKENGPEKSFIYKARKI